MQGIGTSNSETSIEGHKVFGLKSNNLVFTMHHIVLVSQYLLVLLQCYLLLQCNSNGFDGCQNLRGFEKMFNPYLRATVPAAHVIISTKV